MAKREKRPSAGAAQMIGLLAARHAKDVFVTECKDGPTWTGHHKRLDAWALRKTWSPWTCVGYEVKASRADFEQDQKWPGYLSVCHEFYLVCPSGLIKAVDLPPDVGLLWCSPNAQKLHTKIKAKRLAPNPENLCRLMSYVLMSRCRIVADMHEAARDEQPPEDRLAMYREMVADAEERQRLAAFVRGHVARMADAARQQLRDATSLSKQVEHFAERLALLGIT
ncbi:MAG: MmcB family DNA repair protein, partial [Planctomycetota bacterium]